MLRTQPGSIPPVGSELMVSEHGFWWPDSVSSKCPSASGRVRSDPDPAARCIWDVRLLRPAEMPAMVPIGTWVVRRASRCGQPTAADDRPGLAVSHPMACEASRVLELRFRK